MGIIREVVESDWGAASGEIHIDVQYAIEIWPSTLTRITALIDDQLLEMLRCPQDHSALSRADPDVVAKANQAIAAGRLTNIAGQKLEKEIDAGLMRAAGDVMYPVVDEIPVMLPDEAIELSQLG